MALFQDINVEENNTGNFQSQIGKDFANELNVINEQRKEQYAQIKEEQNAWINNLISPDRIEEWNKKGKMSALEVWNKKDANELVPYMATWKQGTKSLNLKNISERMARGEVISNQEKKQLENFVLDMAEIQTRGYTFGGGAVNLITETLPFVAEFGIGLLTSGGTASLGAVGSKVAQKGAQKVVEGAVKEGIGKTIAKGVGKVAYDATINPRTLAFSATRLPQQIRARYGDVMLSDSVMVSEDGQVILQEAKEKPATAFLKALALTNIEVASEMAGMTLFDPIKKQLGGMIAPKILEKLPTKFADKFIKTAQEVTNLPFFKAVESLGFNGIIEEMGEERVGDVLRYAFDLDDKEGYNFEQLLDAIFVSPEQLATEAVAFGVMGVGANIANAGLKKVSQKYDKDDFLIDAGIFRVGDKLDKIDSKVKSELEKDGKTPEEIETVLQGATREDKVQYLRNKDVKNIEVDDFDAVEKVQEQVAQVYMNSNKNLDEKTIKQISTVAGLMASSLAQKENKTFEEIQDALPTVEQVNGYMYADESGKGYTSEEINQVLEMAQNELFNLPEDFSDEGYINQVTKEISVLQDMLMGKLNDEDAQLAWEVLNRNVARKDNALLQQSESVSVAGANENEIEDAQKEWEEKGTESKYFKKWFGESKVVDEAGKPLVVYHGSPNEFEEFNSDITLYGDVSKGFNFFTNKKSGYQNSAKDYADFANSDGYRRNGKIYETYLSIQNPLHIKYTNEIYWDSINNKPVNNSYSTPVEYYDANYNQIKKQFAQGNYDGIIIENTDKNNDDSIIYLVPSANQIKSVDNRGTFDAENPNIYYQNIFNAAKDVFDTSKMLIDLFNKFDANKAKKTIKENKILKPLADYFKDISAKTYIKEMPDWMYKINGSLGEYLDYTNTIYINLKEIKKFTNNGQVFIRVLLHELMHAKQYHLLDYALKNVNNKNLSQGARKMLARYIDTFNVSKEQTKDFKNNNKKKKISNSEELEKVYKEAHNKYENAQMELDADNVALALQANIGNAFDERIKLYSREFNNIESYRKKQIKTKELAEIAAFTDRKNGINAEYGRISDYVDTVTYKPIANKNKLLYQSAYHGTPHKFDEFSLDAIGTGEGAQAHGWGLYFAENKNVSEGYRKTLTGDEFNNEQYYYNNELIEDRTQKAILSTILENGIDKVIQVRERTLFRLLHSLEDYNKEEYEKKEKELNWIKSLDVNKIKKKTDKGQLYEVDIPENDVLLDEQEMLIDQSEFVQEAIEKANKELGLNIVDSGIRGGAIYDKITDKLGSQKEASLYLNKLGIKGITYDGRQDGRCYVIFDDKAVKVLNAFYQDAEPEQQSVFPWVKEAKKIHKVKGGYLPAEKFIELFQNADASTIIHEMGHWYLEELTRRAEHNEEIAEDLEAIRKFLKNQGEAFTREQHEKFARSFEAYILTGSSRNNKIKKVFEDFKNWLLQIYDELKNLGISTKEMPEITNLFDRLLTAEKQRSAAVFNKISAIDEKIAGIIEQQERELDELDEIYKTNIQENNRKSDTKRKVEEYLELASKAAKKKPKEVKEFKQRYKEATLQILEVATGYDRTFISQKRNADKVEEAINNVEDKITISGGMRPEWEEFYADTGVNYETDEVGGDYELASQAWQVFQDGTYKIDDSEYSEIEEFAGQFDYLYGKALSLQGEERYVALEALYSLWSNMPALPNEYLQELMSKVQELEEGVEEAEREAFNRKNFANIPVVEHLQWFITDKIKNLKVYNPETKYRMRLDKSHRLYRFIKGATSINKAKVIVRKINEFVIEDLRNQQRAIIHKEIQKQVRINSKVVRSGSNVKGKFDWKTNSVFLELQELNKKTKQEALEEYEKLAKLSEIQNTQMRDGWDEKETKFDEFKNDFDFNLKRNFIEYKSQTGRLNENAKGQRVSNLNIQLGVKILEDIIKLKEIGREAKSEEELNKKLNKRSYRNNFVQLIREKGQKPWVRKFVTHLLHSGQSLANWETTLNAVLGSEVAQELSLLEDEAAIDSYKREIANKLFNRIRKIYNMGQANAFEMALDYDNVQQIIDLFQAFDKEKYTILETSFDINTGEYFKTNVELTKNQLITLYGWYQNDNLRRRLETQYGAGELLTLFDIALSDSDKDLVWAVIDTLQEMYPDINEVFINETGLSLPQEQNYIPSVAERIVSDLDMLHDCIMASKSPSATKRRKTSNRIKMNPSSLMEIVLPHIDKMSRYVILQEKLNFYRAIFTNANITAAFREVYGKKDGEDLHREIKNQLEEFSFGTTNRRMGKLKEFADGVAKNFIVGSIGGSPKVAIGQLTSMINYSENMPVAQWGAGFAKSLANPVKTFKFMMKNSEYLQARLAGNTQNEIIATLTNEADKFRKVTNFFTLNVKWGDIIAITLGGKPYVDYLVSQGMSLEEAIKKFEAETMRAQQASSASSTSRWQKKQTETALGRMFWAFRTVEFQFERKVFDAILKASRGEVTPSQAIKTILIYRVVNPIIFSVLLQQFAIAPLLRMLFGDDDDPAETWKGLGISGALAVLTANLSHWGYFGIGASFVIQSAMKYLSKDKNMKAFKTQVPFISDVEDVTTKLLKKGGPETEDWVDAMAVGVKYGFGVPADKLVNFGEGIADIAQGKTGIGLLRVGGWGEYAATEAMTGEAPKKKKRKYTKKEK